MNITNSELIIIALQEQVKRLEQEAVEKPTEQEEVNLMLARELWIIKEQRDVYQKLANEAATLLQDTAGTEGVAAPWFAKWQKEQG
jgi:hypothetical protein